MSKWKIWPMLYNFQKEIVKSSYKYNKFAYFLDMGTGKTFTSLGWNEILYGDTKNKVNKTIVVGLSKSKIDWKLASEKGNPINFFTLNAKKRENNITKDSKGITGAVNINKVIIKKWSEDGGILYMGHRQITNYVNEVLKYVNDTVANITDESQSYKSFSSKSTKAWLKLTKNIQYIRLLSGTPRGNSHEDLYTQMKALDYGDMFEEWRTLTAFKDHYMIMIQLPRTYIKIPKGEKNTDELFEKVSKRAIFMKKEETGLELPPKNFVDIHFSDNTINWKQIAKDKIYVVKETGETLFFTPNSLYKMGRMSSSAIMSSEGYKARLSDEKLEVLKELLFQANEKFVIFYEWDLEYYSMVEMLNKNKIPYYSVRGGVDEHREFRDTPVTKDARRPVLLCQYKAASFALNLQTGGISRMIYYTPTNSFMNYQQSQDRIHRSGQVNPVFYYKLINTASIDHKIYERLEKNEDYDKEMFAKDFGITLE